MGSRRPYTLGFAMSFRSTILMSCLLIANRGLIAAEPQPDAGAVEFFEKEIRPLLATRCQKCHGEKKAESGLRLTSRESLLAGGELGKTIVPGKPDESRLIEAVGYRGELNMPPDGKLSAGEIEKLRRWISLGAPWPNDASTSSDRKPFQVTDAHRRWWAFQPVQQIVPPGVLATAWVRSPVDQFVLHQLESRGMSPAPPAEKHTWLRRATFDLTGLPPTPDEVDNFASDDSPDAAERVIDRLLTSPAYSERWARHWLDVVRYADYHDGNPTARVASCEPMNAWRYRDWVVASLARDLPFDHFIVHQIAGDLLPSPDGQEFYADGLIATTMLSNGVWDRGDADKEKIVSDMVDDQIDTIGKAFLGLTLGCARCHDHKFDPISQSDYYALAGIFYSTHILKELGTKGGEYTLNRVPLATKAYRAEREDQLRRIAEFNAKVAALEKKSPKLPADDEERQKLAKQRDRFQAELLPEPPVVEAAQEGGTPGGLFPGIGDVPLHLRGSYTRLGPIVARRFPVFFKGDNQPPISSGSGRRELAAWIASKDNPLTARVIANRLWQGHFGAGLVATANNLGMTSQPPSHPELLDWLATRLVDDGWLLKKLHRRIVLSATYRQSSAAAPARNPKSKIENPKSPTRLEAEAIRDAILAVSGQLDGQTGGPAGADVQSPRRSLYVQTARWDRGSFALLFDAANPDQSTEKRMATTVAPQALFLLNDEFVRNQAKHLSERLLREVPDDETARLSHAYRLLFARSPSVEEIEVCRELLTAAASHGTEAAWRELAHVLLCSNEFVYVD
jgi:cytochrome c553